ncbi:Pectic acid lyase [Pseudobythopirellula maris]|uniref:Pectic acid lyase n=1 Tax=Pseudobythopirellula maris TaxID=2527991 RepID=A0A5C5ZLV6_9BACT|nr:pectate lyase [Pseudobythopirellula maris]TWT87423.1 Pectic acid lyase [Pseudobythopirellula maris]
MTLLRPIILLLLLVCHASWAEAQHADPQETQLVRWWRVFDQPAEWYGGADAQRIGDNVLAYQSPNGGWCKNVDMAVPHSEEQLAELRRNAGRRETLIDNGATYTQIRLLSHIFAATGETRFGEARDRGLDFVYAMQYPNGGWPMIHPLQDNYTRRITFNDGSMIGVMRLLTDVAEGAAPFDTVDSDRQAQARQAVERGLEAILRMQVRVDGRPTVWCAQHNEVDLTPTGARTYELPSLSGMESVEVVQYLMDVEEPSDEVIAAIEGAVDWFERAKITGKAVRWRDDPSLSRGRDRIVVDDPNGDPLWGRFYEIATNKPMFVGRDGVVKDTLAEIEYERRVGYSWIGSYAKGLLAEDYPAWRKRIGSPVRD